MKRTLLWSSLLFLSVAVSAQTSTSLTSGAQLLFKETKSKLTTAEKNNIYSQLGFLLSADKKQFIADKEAADYPFYATVYPTDLNGDGKEEIFVLFGNTYTSGMTGSNVVLYIKNGAGKYVPNLGFPGTIPDAIAVAGKPYPDLLIGGPGFEFPLWRWNGKEYAFYRRVKEAEYIKMKKENIETVSSKYTAKL